MAHKLRVGGVVLAALLGWAGLGSVVFYGDPDFLWHRLLFFLSFFGAWLLLGWLVAYVLSYRFFTPRRLRGDLGRAFLQAVPWAVAITLMAWLQSLRLLTLLNAAILLGLFTTIEYLVWPREGQRL